MDREVQMSPLAGTERSAEPAGSAHPNQAHPSRLGPVTVLYADLCGYTGLSASMTPEDLHDVMTQLFGGIARIVTKYDGHIDKLLGDAALVLFGVPNTHEDDALRAVRAAIEIRAP